MSNRHFYHFSALPMSMRMVYTRTLLVPGTGYLSPTPICGRCG
jgi:hypothetical protein